MRLWLTASVSAWLVLQLPAAPVADVSSLRQGVFILRAEMAPGASRNCTAFLVAPERVATAAHCAPGLSAAVTLLDHHGSEWSAVVVVYSPLVDVAILQSAVKGLVLTLGRDPVEDEDILAFGAVAGFGPFSLRGRIAGRYEHWLVAQIPGSDAGSSGGPVLCGGAVCGMSQARMEPSKLIGIAPVSVWKDLVVGAR